VGLSGDGGNRQSNRIGLYAGLLAAALGGLDAFVFTAGIGENSPGMRSRIVETLVWLGGKLDAQANAAAATSIAARDSRIGLYVIPTDEELMIARHTLALLAARRAKPVHAQPEAKAGAIRGPSAR
jgi:acetate kinase